MFTRYAFFEKYYPIFIGVGSAIITGIFLSEIPLKSVPNILAATINISAISVGFLATAKSILLVISNDKVISMLKKGGQYDLLLNYLMRAVVWSFSLSVFSVLGLMVTYEASTKLNTFIMIGTAFIAGTAISACYRVIDLFGVILRERGNNCSIEDDQKE